MPELRFQISDALSPAIARALDAAVDFTPAMREVAGLLETETRQRFEAGAGPTGLSWLPSQRALEEGGKTLVDTGALLSSIASAFTATEAVAGTNVIYAAIQQFGGTIRPRTAKALKTPFGPRGSVRLPARPFLGFGPVEEAEIPEILLGHINDAFQGRPQ